MSASPSISAAQAILSYLIPLAIKQIGLAWGFKDDLQRLVDKLELIQALLRDAENRRGGVIIRLETMRLWLKRLNSVACRADDVLDEFKFETLRRKIEVKNLLKNKVRNFFSFSNPLPFRFKMAYQVKDINSMLDNLCKEANDIGLRAADQLLNATNTTVEPRELNFRLTHPYVDDSQVVGRDGDASTVIDMLLDSYDSGDDLFVIAIVGMGGMGKTTLAQLVYNNAKVVEHFGDQKLWICVSDDFKVERLLNEMVESLTGNKSETQNIEGIVRTLRKKLNGKKYLLVLDDVWNENPHEWECMKNSLLGIGGSKGSKIIATTRSMNVVSTMRTSPSLTHHLSQLSENDSWTMFRKRAFANGGPIETPNLVTIGSRMVKKCKGVPLAIKSLAGLMYSKQYEHEWMSIENSEIWSSLETKNGIQPILRLSFDHLPSSSLKQCFAYCSVFPKDFVIQKDELVQLWMAQGYIQRSLKSNLEMEDVGNDYFKILWHNSLFQDVKLDECNNITSCKMHDLVHDLALDVSEGKCLTSTSTSIVSEMKYNPDVQHLSLNFKGNTSFDIPKENIKKLRTLFLDENLPKKIAGKSRTLCLNENLSKKIAEVKWTRALCLVFHDLKELPSLLKFIHLRYLDFARSSIETLPDFITKLYNLQTLRLPLNTNFKKFPKEFYKLVSLRHFYICDIKENRKLMPIMIGQLTSLQTLPFFVVGEDGGQKIEELGNLSNLRGILKIYNLQHLKNRKEAEKANISERPNIQQLAFYWDIDSREPYMDFYWDLITKEPRMHFYRCPPLSDEDLILSTKDTTAITHEEILEGLKPHQNLRVLKLNKFKGQSFASWMMMSKDVQLLQNLVKIELSDCTRCEEIPPLGHLPHLEVIIMFELNNLRRIAPKFYGHHIHSEEGIVSDSSCSGATTAAKVGAPSVVFAALRELVLFNMPQLQEWCGPSESYSSPNNTRYFPRLQWLHIGGCPELTSIPGHLLSLQIITIFRNTIGPGMEKMYFPRLRMELSPSWTNDVLVADLLEKSRKTLKELTAKDIDTVWYLANNLQNLMSLENLCILGCPNLTSLIEKTEEEASNSSYLTSLRTLGIYNCKNLTCIPKGLLQQTLVRLEITHCPNLIMSDQDEFSCSLTSLQQLKIHKCPRLASWWEKMPFCLTSLQKLAIGGFSNELECFPWPSISAVDPKQYPFISLKSLILWGWERVKYLPDQLQHLTALSHLSIRLFYGLEALPEWLGNLSSLHSLHLYECSNLMNLPTLEAMQRLTNLRSLTIEYCPLLEERCARESGQEWHKIAHIPSNQDLVD